jgi:hypothetical protein
MTLKQRAAWEVAKLVGLAATIGVGTGILLNTVPLTIIGIGFCSIAIIMGLKWIYEVKLGQLEAEEKCKNFAENSNRG